MLHPLPFEEENAERYDKWYDTPQGREADRLEKDLFLKLVKPQKGQTLLRYSKAASLR